VIPGDFEPRDNTENTGTTGDRGAVGGGRDDQYETLPPGHGGALVLRGEWQGEVGKRRDGTTQSRPPGSGSWADELPRWEH